MTDDAEFGAEKAGEGLGQGMMKSRNGSRGSTNESMRSANMDKSCEGEESDDTASTNPCQQFNLGCHDNGMGSDFNCQSINNNTIESFEYRKTKTDQQNRISVLKEGKTYYQDAMKKEKTLKRQFSIQAEHDYHGKYGREVRALKRSGDGNVEETPSDEQSVANGSHSDWESGKEASDGELSKHLISYQINETEVGKRQDGEEKIEARDNGAQINYNDAIDGSDYRYFYNENNYKAGSYCTGEYYGSFRTTKGDVMFNEKDMNLINDHRAYGYHGAGSGNAEFGNGNEIVSYLKQQDEMFLIQDAFQNPVIHKNIDQVIADTLKNDEDRPFAGYVNYQNGSSPKDDGSSDSSQEPEKINSKILNLSHIKYSQSSRVSSVLATTESDHTSHAYDSPPVERMSLMGRVSNVLTAKSTDHHAETYESSFSERMSLLESGDLDFEQSPSPNRELQSLDSPPTSRTQGDMVSLTTNASTSGRFDNSSLHPTSSVSVMHCLNSLTTNSTTTGVLQALSPSTDIANADCDEQVRYSRFYSSCSEFKIIKLAQTYLITKIN